MSDVNDEPSGICYHLEAKAENGSQINQLGSGAQINVAAHYHVATGSATPVLIPFDLTNMRLWIESIAQNFSRQAREAEPELSNKEISRHRKELEALYISVSDRPTSSAAKDAIRRLAAGGMAQYLARAGHTTSASASEHLLVDILVFALWPVVIARKLPSSWQQDLMELTSPRVAAITAASREAIARQRPMPVEEFVRQLTARPLTDAIRNLFDDLGDHQRGGAALTAIAIACGLPRPPRGRAKAIASWICAVLSGVAVGIVTEELAERFYAVSDIGVEVVEHNFHHGHGKGNAVEHLIEELFHLF